MKDSKITNSSNLTNVPPLKVETPMIQLSIIGNLCIINGVSISLIDLQLFFGYHGFHVVKDYDGLKLHHEIAWTLSKIPDNELNKSLLEFTRFSDEDKASIRKIVQEVDFLIENLNNN